MVQGLGIELWKFNATVKNISIILWWSIIGGGSHRNQGKSPT
jgi:hypothetical protein